MRKFTIFRTFAMMCTTNLVHNLKKALRCKLRIIQTCPTICTLREKKMIHIIGNSRKELRNLYWKIVIRYNINFLRNWSSLIQFYFVRAWKKKSHKSYLKEKKGIPITRFYCILQKISQNKPDNYYDYYCIITLSHYLKTSDGIDFRTRWWWRIKRKKTQLNQTFFFIITNSVIWKTIDN